ncbi:MAG: YihY/virulence factor BrkB family protein [Ignavibacteriaceae bacterium]|jgi:membrane protein|nr:YihY/virulence factor BrkB family protein [Ignavibacteriaceae bacterium]
MLAYFKKLTLLYKISPNFKKFVDSLRYYVMGMYHNTDQHHLFLFAGGLAFSLFVCIIPFNLIVFWILGYFLESSSVEMQINHLIDTIIPYAVYADFAKNILFKRINEVIEYRNIVGFIGVIGLFFAASGFLSSIRTVLNKVFGASGEINFLLGYLRDFVTIIIVIFAFLVVTIVLPLIDVLRQASEQFRFFEFLQYGIFQKIFTSLLSVVLIYFLFSWLYKFVPTVKISKRGVRFGAFWAALLWEIAKQIFGFYIYNFATYGKIYGTYALAVVIAFWIYYSAVVFIVGAEMGKLFYDKNITTKKLSQISLFSK